MKMSDREAIEVLEKLFFDTTNEDYPFMEEFGEAVHIAIEALKKRTPVLKSERLTYVDENGEVLFHPEDFSENEGLTITQLADNGRYKALEEIAERLANREQCCEFLEKELMRYRDLEEQGLLLRLPCKVGDMVYYILGIPQKTPCVVEATNFELQDINKIGKTLFLTQSEAEEKLRELEEK